MSGSIGDRQSTGRVEPGFEEVRVALDAMLLSDPQFSGQVAAVWRGRSVVDLAGGPDLALDSVTGVFSVSKGVAATVIGLLLDRGQLDLDVRVADYWPEFAAAGKQEVTVRTLLSHRAGVFGSPDGFSPEELADSRLAAAKLAASPPLWHPGSAHGYHALSIGILMEELVRRITGRTLQQIYEAEVRAPRDIDFYLGLPEEQEARFREVLAVPPTPSQLAELLANANAPDNLQALAFNAFLGEFPPAAGAMGPNSREMREAGFASIDGIGSARGLARVYAAILGDDEHSPLISRETITEMSREHSFGLDRVLGMPMCFGVVFMKPLPRMEFGSFAAFGHDGAGGALAFADPTYDLGFGYIPMPMQFPGGADPKGVRLSQLVRECIRRLA
jgi:CubicO group peptidase (beta-lactamase class C family)